jgi:hypothetical protein
MSIIKVNSNLIVAKSKTWQTAIPGLPKEGELTHNLLLVAHTDQHGGG